jgi:hypothetical protein
VCQELKKILFTAGKSEVEEAKEYLESQLKFLQKSGDIDLDQDKNLTGLSLELRVYQLFQQAGLNISEGRTGQEDFLITAEANGEFNDNIVIEVKSSRSPNPKLDDLRQLDDWVFDLSGEEKARKHGLGGGPDTLAMATNGQISLPKKHPTPHKGVLIFNGPIGIQFEDRVAPILHPNQIDFVEKRNFCIIGINKLASLITQEPENIWSILHTTVGEC